MVGNDRYFPYGSGAQVSEPGHDERANEHIDDNGTLSTLGPDTVAVAINNCGEVVGSGPGGGFIYDNGIFTTLTAPGGFSTNPTAINDRGEVAGTYDESSGVSHGFVDDNGTFATLNVPGSIGTFVTAINDRGEVAGWYIDSNGEQHGFLAKSRGR